MEEKSMKTIARGALILFAGALLGKTFSFVYRIILSRLGEQAYGEFALGLALFGILGVISILGLDTGTLKFVSVFRAEKNESKIKGTILYSSKIVFLLSIVGGTILFLSSDWIATTFFHTERLGLIIKILALALPFEGLRTILSNSLKAFKRIDYEVYGRILGENFIKIVFSVIFITLGLDVIGAALAYSLSIVLSFFALFYLFNKKTFPLLSKNILAVTESKQILMYSIPLVLNSLTLMVIAWADSLMLGYFMDTGTVGVYNVADPAAKLILIFPTAFAALYLPLIAEVHVNKEEFKKVYLTTTKWIFLINSMALAWILLYSKDLITFFFTETYIAATGPLSILIIGYFINGAVYTSRDILLLRDKTKHILQATIACSLTNIIFNLYLIPRYGMIGAAIGTTSSLIILSALLFINTQKEIQINPFTKKIGAIIIVTALAAGITKFITNIFGFKSLILTIIVSLVLLPLLSLTMFAVVGLLEKEDKEIFAILWQKVSNMMQWKK